MKNLIFLAVMWLMLSCSSDDDYAIEKATVTYRVSANETILHTARITRIGSEGVSLGSPQTNVVLPWEETITDFEHIPTLRAYDITAHNGDDINGLLVEIYYNGELKEFGSCETQGCAVDITYLP